MIESQMTLAGVAQEFAADAAVPVANAPIQGPDLGARQGLAGAFRTVVNYNFIPNDPLAGARAINDRLVNFLTDGTPPQPPPTVAEMRRVMAELAGTKTLIQNQEMLRRFGQLQLISMGRQTFPEPIPNDLPKGPDGSAGSLDWMEGIPCNKPNQKVKPDDFFPAPGYSTAEVQKMCRSCPVIDACLLYGLSMRSKTNSGIWGGLSERNLRPLRGLLHRGTSQEEIIELARKIRGYPVDASQEDTLDKTGTEA